MQQGRYALIQAFDQLNAVQHSFVQELNKHHCHIKLLHQDSFSSSELLRFITNIWHTQTGDGRRTENLYGLVGVPPHVIPIIQQLNQAKANFKKSIKEFRAEYGDPNETLFKRAEELNLALQQGGLARLNLNHCYRLIPVLESCPKKITFSWYSSGRSLKKFSLFDAQERLLKMDTSQLHIQMQLQALARLPDSETLVQLQPQVPVMRANIVWKKQEQLIRKARNCPLPLFFPLDGQTKFPEYNTPPITPPEQRSRQLRSDVSIDPEPYLPSLRMHRYKK